MIPQTIVETAVAILDSKKAENIVVLDVGELTALADHFVIATGTSSTQVQSLAGEVEKKLKEQGREPLHIENNATNSQWILLDYDTVLIHIFYKDAREFYDLERLWADAPEQNISQLLEQIEKTKEKGDI